MARDYKAEYARFHSKPGEIKRRALRNRARRRAVAKHGKAKLRGKDVHHVKPSNLGSSPTRIVSRSKNRGYKRSSTNKNLGLR
jgi:hypothetical protein